MHAYIGKINPLALFLHTMVEIPVDVLVLGAGVAGLTSAYLLAREGHRVTIIDRRPGVALEGSFANGGQLSYHHAAPMAGPGVIGKLPRWLFSAQSPVQLHLRADLRQISWLVQFLRACNGQAHDQTTRKLLALTALSQTLMQAFVRQHATDFDWRPSGKLTVYSTDADMENAQRVATYKETLGCEVEILSRDDCVDREPALKTIAYRLTGGAFAPQEETADCYKFCRELQTILEDPPYGVEFMLGTNVTQLVTVGKRVVGANTNQGLIEADAVVLALGCDAGVLTRPLGYDPPIYPVKGYSLSLPIDEEDGAPRLSVTDFSHQIVYARLRNRLRVAGMADIGDRSTDFGEGRLDLLAQQASHTSGLNY